MFRVLGAEGFRGFGLQGFEGGSGPLVGGCLWHLPRVLGGGGAP